MPEIAYQPPFRFGVQVRRIARRSVFCEILTDTPANSSWTQGIEDAASGRNSRSASSIDCSLKYVRQCGSKWEYQVA